MRLSTIKLSGFKSFVDPTTLHLPTNMTGVVGPERLRQVQHHRRRALGDGRKLGQPPARRFADRRDLLRQLRAQAGVAGDGRAGVRQLRPHHHRRVRARSTRSRSSARVSRDGPVSYYLNGARCRRRDITDLFLGTGLGPRSYSIIEQGMISQIIEARPEDLRVFLEEAAGISKYKERRKETETRIRHTRENLERLSDLREEVGKQLEHLKRQARQAEQYQVAAGRAEDQGRRVEGAGIPRPRCAACRRCAKSCRTKKPGCSS